MSITASEMSPADMRAVLGNGDNGGFGGFGGDGAWWLLVLLFAMNGGWFGGGYGNRQGGGIGGDALYPWMNQAQSNWEGISTLQNSLCNGFAGVTSAVQNGFAQAEIAANARQMADMNQNFALQSQLANCCCENRLASANLNSTIISENCADREALNSVGRDIIANQNAGFQRIVDNDNANYRQIYDWLCQKELRDEQRENANLRQQLQMADLRASQSTQTATIQAGQRALASEIEQYVLPTARPAYIVPNPNCCQNSNNGCGCNNGFAN